MDFETFDEFQSGLFVQAAGMKQKKGVEYTRGDGDRLANFKRIAAMLGVTPEQVCMVYLMKHVDAITHYSNQAPGERRRNASEPIRGRIVDVITYYTLLLALIDEADIHADINSPVRAQVDDEIKTIYGISDPLPESHA